MRAGLHHGERSALDPCAIARKGWLAEQPVDFQNRMAVLGRWRTYDAGESIYEVGDEAEAIIGLESGLADVLIPISQDEMVTLHRAHSGFWIGEASILPGARRIVSLIAHTECVVFAIPAPRLQRHLKEMPQDVLPFLALSFSNTQLALSGLSEVLALPPRPRFARMLLRQLSDDGCVRATQTELGAMAGMSRAAFRRAFSELIDAGTIRTEYGKIRVLDRAALEAEAKGH
jgi:CRP-like cAMP-binding protein